MTTPETLADRYQLGPLLSRGGMGTVHSGRDLLLDREVAVKLLDVAGAPPDALERFRREARLLASLSHPNVVTVFDVGLDAERAWLVMELLPGPTLARLIDGGPLPVAEAVRYARDCAAGLVAAHERGIVHRDIKPANLMVNADGALTLVDLGIARLASSTQTSTQLTVAGTIVGTVPYIAPEIATGGAVTPAADLYALGCVLFAMLTGHPPFTGDPVSVLSQHAHAPIPAVGALRPDAPSALTALVTSLLAKDPGARPDAGQTLAALSAMLDTEALVVPGLPGAPGAPPVATAILPPPVPPPTARMPAGTSVSPLLADEAGIRAEPHRGRGWWWAGGAVAVAALIALVVALSSGGSPSPAGQAAGVTPTSSGPAPSTPAAAPTGKVTSAAATPTSSAPTATTATQATTPGAALAALRSDLQAAVNGGGLAAKDATDLNHRLDDLTKTLTGGGKGKGDAGKAQQDAAHKAADLATHLSDLHEHGMLSDSAYATLSAAANRLIGLLGGGGEGD